MLYVGGKRAVKIHVVYNYNYRILSLILFPRETSSALREDFPDVHTIKDFDIIKEVINKIIGTAGYKLSEAREVTPDCWRHVFVRDETLTGDNLFSMNINDRRIHQIKLSLDFRAKQLYLAFLTPNDNNLE